MIYVDSSVLLAELFGEDQKPSETLWDEQLTSSRLSEYEVWTRLHALDVGERYEIEAARLLGGVSLLDMTPRVLGRALEPFPVALRTLDALHVASIEHLRAERVGVSLATFDRRMTDAARAMDIPLWEGL